MRQPIKSIIMYNEWNNWFYSALTHALYYLKRFKKDNGFKKLSFKNSTSFHLLAPSCRIVNSNDWHFLWPSWILTATNCQMINATCQFDVFAFLLFSRCAIQQTNFFTITGWINVHSGPTVVQIRLVRK